VAKDAKKQRCRTGFISTTGTSGLGRLKAPRLVESSHPDCILSRAFHASGSQLSAQHQSVRRRVDADFHPVSSNPHHGNANLAIDAERLAGFACKDQHFGVSS
jgi:hypothetical protein